MIRQLNTYRDQLNTDEPPSIGRSYLNKPIKMHSKRTQNIRRSHGGRSIVSRTLRSPRALPRSASPPRSSLFSPSTTRLTDSCFFSLRVSASRGLSFESWSGRGARSLAGEGVPVRQHHRHPRPARRHLRPGPLRRAVRGAVHVEVPGHQGRHRRLHAG